MDMDIIITAIIAAILLGRLWMVLGRRNDGEIQRPNPFASLIPKDSDDETFAAKKAEDAKIFLPPVFKHSPASVAGGLEQIKARDNTFDEKTFLKIVGANFTKIIDAFAKGDIEVLSPLLMPDVLALFQKAIANRKANNQIAESQVIRIKEAETIAARLEGDKAFLTVKFFSDQENILRDDKGNIIGGELGKSEEIVDSWVFVRDVTKPDAPWLLAQTGV